MTRQGSDPALRSRSPSPSPSDEGGGTLRRPNAPDVQHLPSAPLWVSASPCVDQDFHACNCVQLPPHSQNWPLSQLAVTLLLISWLDGFALNHELLHCVIGGKVEICHNAIKRQLPTLIGHAVRVAPHAHVQEQPAALRQLSGRRDALGHGGGPVRRRQGQGARADETHAAEGQRERALPAAAAAAPAAGPLQRCPAASSHAEDNIMLPQIICVMF